MRPEPSQPQIGAPAYWAQPLRPFTSLAFVIPLLLLYELGTAWLGPHAVRNGADLWMRGWLDRLGFSQHLLLPLLTCSLLLAWHHLQRHGWTFRWGVYYGMLLESLAFGSLLVMLAHAQGFVLAESTAQIETSVPSTVAQAGLMIAYLGAGIYEELLFRLMLLPATAGLLRSAGLSSRTSWFSAILVTSLLFALAHYRLHLTVAGYPIALAYGDPFQWFSFVFRFLAGIIFALLFVYRGFGIAAGTHALYDVFAATL